MAGSPKPAGARPLHARRGRLVSRPRSRSCARSTSVSRPAAAFEAMSVGRSASARWPGHMRGGLRGTAADAQCRASGGCDSWARTPGRAHRPVPLQAQGSSSWAASLSGRHSEPGKKASVEQHRLELAGDEIGPPCVGPKSPSRRRLRRGRLGGTRPAHRSIPSDPHKPAFKLRPEPRRGSGPNVDGGADQTHCWKSRHRRGIGAGEVKSCRSASDPWVARRGQRRPGRAGGPTRR